MKIMNKRMPYRRWTNLMVSLSAGLLLLLVAFGITRAAAPPLPARFYGAATLNGTTTPTDVTVTASVNGVPYAQSISFVEASDSVYFVDVPADDPETVAVEGAVEGDTVTFEIDGYAATQSAIWSSGALLLADLDAIPPPLAPTAANQNVTTDEDAPHAITLVATDPNADSLAYTIVTTPTHGTLSGNLPTLTYTPNPNYNGPDSFTFQANDGQFDSNAATVAITVNPVPDPPRIAPIGDITVDENQILVVPVSATDPDGDSVDLGVNGVPNFVQFFDNHDGTGTLEIAPTYDDSGVYPGIEILATDGTYYDLEYIVIRVNEVTPLPIASFTVPKAMNVVLAEDGAAVVDASSFNGSFSPTNMIAASTNSTWRTATGQVTNQWTKIRLAGDQIHVIDQVRLRGGSIFDNGLKDFEIRVSTTGYDDADFMTVFAGTVPLDTDYHEFNFAPVPARYVQLFILNNWGSSGGVQVANLEVWTRGREGGLASLAEGPPASIVDFSSQNSTLFGPKNAIDENPSTSWATENFQNTNQWLKVALGGGNEYIIDRVRFISPFSSAGIKDFEVRVSNTTSDDAAFITVFAGSAAATTSIQEFEFAPSAARYVQIYAFDNFGHRFIQLDSLQFLTARGRNAARLEGVGAFVLESSSNAGAALGAKNAIDYSTATTWQTLNGAITNQWFKLLLLGEETYTIDHITLQAPNSTAAPKDFQLRVSATTSDDASFTTVFSGTLPQDGRSHWFRLPPVTARYVQLYINNNHGSPSYIQLQDFNIYTSQLGGATVAFDDRTFTPAGQIISWAWDFGDGNTSNDQFPEHTYAAPGTYEIQFTVTTDTGSTDTFSSTYTVLRPPIASFSWSPTDAEEFDVVTFSSTSTSPDSRIVSWEWLFEGGSPSRTTEIATARFPNNGQYAVNLAVRDAQELRASVELPVDVANATPAVDVGPDRTIVWGQEWSQPFVVSDASPEDAGALSCTWDFGDGQTVTVAGCSNVTPAIPYSYTLPGVYTATLSATDPDGATGSDSLVLTVNRRDVYLNVYVAEYDPLIGRVNIVAKLLDPWNGWAPVENHTVTLAAAGQAIDLATDALGEVAATFINANGVDAVSATFVETPFYLGGDDASPVLALPRGDIVFMLDESGSMTADIAEVRQRVAEIASQLDGQIDFQLGLVGFGAAAHLSGPPIENTVPHIHIPLSDNLDSFSDALNILVTASSIEPGFDAVVLGMGDQMGFRPNAGVCAVMISDENAGGLNQIDASKADALAALNARSAVFLGIVDLTYGADDYGPNPGSLADETSGIVVNLLDFRADESAVLQTILERCVQHVHEVTAPDLVVTKTDERGQVAAGDVLTYTVSITNSTTYPANRVALTDTLPLNTQFISASHEATYNAGMHTVTWPLFTILSGDSTTRTVSVAVTDNLHNGVVTITNHVEAVDLAVRGIDNNPLDNSAVDTTDVLAAPDLQLTLSDGGNIVHAGDLISYTLVYSNVGSQDATGVFISDTVPAGTIFDASGSAGGWVCVDGVSTTVCTFAVGDLAVTFNGSISFTVRVDDPLGIETTEIINIAAISDDGNNGVDETPSDNSTLVVTRIAPPNQAPVALDDTYGIDEDTINHSLDVLVNDDDPDTGILGLTIVAIDTPSHGTASTDGGAVFYTPAEDFHGDDSFSYTISDGELTASATVFVTVNPANDPPTANDDAVNIDEDTVENVAVLANDTDVDGDLLVLVEVLSPLHGTTAISGSLVIYTPTLNFHGADTFTYMVSDGQLTAVGTVHVTVLPVNDPPQLVDVQIEPPVVDENGTITLTGQLNDPDATDTHTVTVNWGDDTSITINLAAGISDFSASHQYVDDGTSGSSSGEYLVTVVVDDQVGAAAAGDLSVTVNNVAPSVTISGPTVVNEGETGTYAYTIVDPGADEFVLNSQSCGSGATLETATFDGTSGVGSFVCVFGGDTTSTQISVVVQDDDGGVGSDALLVTINIINYPPQAQDDIASTDEDTSVSIDVLANDSDVDGDSLFVVDAGPAAEGFLFIIDAALVFTPAINFTGQVTVPYTMSDGVLTDTALVTITVLPVNDPPIAHAGTDATGDEGTSVTFDGTGSFDPDIGDTLHYAWEFGDGATAAGALSEHAYADNGVYDVCLTVTDDANLSGTACITASINNVAPRITITGSTSVNEDVSATYTFTVTDPGADEFALDEQSCGSNATISALTFDSSSGAGSFTCTFSAGPSTTEVSVATRDDDGGVGTDSLLVTINETNDPPTADAGADVMGDEGVIVNFDGSASMDPDSGDALTYTWDFGDGTTAVGALVNHSYGDNGEYAACLTVTDSGGQSDSACVTATIANVAPRIDSIIGPTEPLDMTDQPFSIEINFSDLGSADTHDVTWSWDDGSGDTQSNVVTPAAQSHTYSEPGVYQVMVTVTDDDGDFDSEGYEVVLVGTEITDLAVNATDIFFDPDNPEPGQTVTLRASVRNLGAADAINVLVDFRDMDRLLGQVTIPVLAGGATAEVEIETVFSSASLHLIAVVVDPANTILETNEENNEATKVLAVGELDPSQATMVILASSPTVCQGATAIIDGQAYYDFADTPGENDHPVQGASISVSLLAPGTNNVIGLFTGAHTNLNGSYSQAILAPVSNGSYPVRVSVTDQTITQETNTTLTVSGACPETPPPPPPPTPTPPPDGQPNPGTPPPSSPPNTSPHTVYGDVYIRAEDIFFSDDNPDPGQTLSIFAYTHYYGIEAIFDIPVTIYDIFPVSGVLTKVVIGHTQVSFPAGGSSSPVAVSVPWIGDPAGAHIIQVVLAPPFDQFTLNDKATRLIVVGDVPEIDLAKSVMLLFDADADGLPSPGDTLQYTIDFVNVGSGNATNVVILDDYDETLLTSLGQISGAGTAQDGVITWNVGTLAAGASGTVSYQVNLIGADQFPAGLTVIRNVALLTSDTTPTVAAYADISIAVNAPPTANAGVNVSGIEGESIAFDGSGSTDADVDDVLSYTWDFGDGTTGEGAIVHHAYLDDGDYSVCLAVTDSGGLTDTSCIVASIDNAPPSVIVSGPINVNPGETYSYSVVVTDPGTADTHTIVWNCGEDEIFDDGTELDVHCIAPTDVSEFTVTAQVTDDNDGVGEGTLLVSVNGVNRPPEANDDTVATTEDFSVTIDILANDHDPDNDPLDIVAAGPTVTGTLAFTSSGVVFTPTLNFSGVVTFAYVISDGDLTDTALVTITVLPENDPPDANDDYEMTAEDTPIAINVLGNDRELDDDPLMLTMVSQPTSGTVIISGTRIVYTPTLNFFGSDAFMYTITDGTLVDWATVFVDVSPVNDAPLLLDDEVTTARNTPVTVEVLANDWDAENDPLTVVNVTNPTSGTTELQIDNTIIYRPNPGFAGVDSFTYDVDDGFGGLAAATVVVIVELPPIIYCELYPIALAQSTLAGVTPSSSVLDILNGGQPGNFGWLTWSGNPNVPTMVANLTPPGNSDTYVNPHDSADHSITLSDWVQGKPGVSNAKQVRNALDALIGKEIIVPVWDETEGQGNNANYRISGFALIRITSYHLPGQNRISVDFLGNESCGETSANITGVTDSDRQLPKLFLPILSGDMEGDVSSQGEHDQYSIILPMLYP